MLYVPQTMCRITDNSLWLYTGFDSPQQSEPVVVDENGVIHQIPHEQFRDEFKTIKDEWNKPQAGTSIVNGGFGFFGKALVTPETRPDLTLRRYISMSDEEKQRLRMELLEPAVKKFLELCLSIETTEDNCFGERKIRIVECISEYGKMPNGFDHYFWNLVEQRVDEVFGLWGQHEEGAKLQDWQEPNFARDRFYVVGGRLFHRNCHFHMEAVLVKRSAKDLHGAQRLAHWLHGTLK